MEFIITGDILDTELSGKVIDYMPEFYTKKETYYKLIINFSIEALLKNEDLNALSEEDSLKKRIYDLLGYQLREIDKVLCEQGIEIISSHIQGVRSQNISTIKIYILEYVEEEDAILRTNKEGKSKRKRMKTFVTAPDLDFTQHAASSLAVKELAGIYSELMKTLRNKKFMSEILEIEQTESDELLFEAFCNQYKGLWLVTENKKKLLLDKIRHKAQLVVAKHSIIKNNME